LIISDLTMPIMDGFTLLQHLRQDKRTHDIPVIVVSARDITPAERQRLSGQIEAHYQKGSLSPKAFVEQVVHVLGDKTLREGDK
jgi:CheY-like chemotaxis protein